MLTSAQGTQWSRVHRWPSAQWAASGDVNRHCQLGWLPSWQQEQTAAHWGSQGGPWLMGPAGLPYPYLKMRPASS